jgi:integrase
MPVGRVSLREAELAAADVDRVLLRLQQKLLTMPPDAGVVEFVRNGGKLADDQPAVADTLFKTLVERYLEAHSHGALEENSLMTVRLHLNHVEKTLGKNFRLATLKQPDLQKHIDRRAKAKGIHGAKLSAATLRKEIASFRAAWNWGLTSGLVAAPFPNRGLVFPKGVEKSHFMTYAEIQARVEAGHLKPNVARRLWDCLFLTLPEVAELLEHVRTSSRHPWLYPMVCFAAHTGARRSEMLRAECHDVDLTNQTAVIREKKRAREKRTTRRVPLSPGLCEVLRSWLAAHPGGLNLFCHAGDLARSHKSRTSPQPVTRDEAHDHFQRVLAGSKWSVLRGWHVLRHSFASNCAARAVDQRFIDEWMGHQTEEMRKRYRHLIPSTQLAAIRSVFSDPLVAADG